ncbi:hypothetical protein WA158_004948 [Blastocystis sp. Blastoise]
MSFKIFFLVVSFVSLAFGEYDVFMHDHANYLKSSTSFYSLYPSEYISYVNSLLGMDASFKQTQMPVCDVFDTVEHVVAIHFASQSLETLNTTDIGKVEYAQIPYGKLNFIPETYNTTTNYICYSADNTTCPTGYQMKTYSNEEDMFASLDADISSSPSSFHYVYVKSTVSTTVLENTINGFPKTTISMVLFNSSSTYHSLTPDTNINITEVVDYQIYMWTALALIIIMAVVILAVINIDYGEDTAGLFGKYHPSSSSN